MFNFQLLIPQKNVFIFFVLAQTFVLPGEPVLVVVRPEVLRSDLLRHVEDRPLDLGNPPVVRRHGGERWCPRGRWLRCHLVLVGVRVLLAVRYPAARAASSSSGSAARAASKYESYHPRRRRRLALRPPRPAGPPPSVSGTTPNLL